MGRKTSKEELARIGAKTRFKAGEKQAQIASLGGIASGVAKREKRTMREIAEIILSKDVMTSDGVVSGKYAVLAKVIDKALKGDLQAATFIRDTIGEKPTDKQEITGADGENITPVNITIVPISADIDKNKNKEKTKT